MTQAAALSPTLPANTSSVAGGASGFGDEASGDGLFSSLLSMTESLPGVSSDVSASLDQAAAMTDAPLSVSLPGEGATLDVEPVLQDAADLKNALARLLAVLNGGAEGSENDGEGQLSSDDASSIDPAVAETQEAPVWVSISTIVDDLVSAEKSLDKAPLSKEDADTLTDAIQELLALMQAVVQALRQAAMTSGGTSSAPPETTGSLDAASANARNTLSALSPALTLADPEAAQDLLPASSDASLPEDICALIKEAEKSAEKLASALAQPAPSKAAAGAESQNKTISSALVDGKFISPSVSDKIADGSGAPGEETKTIPADALIPSNASSSDPAKKEVKAKTSAPAPDAAQNREAVSTAQAQTVQTTSQASQTDQSLAGTAPLQARRSFWRVEETAAKTEREKETEAARASDEKPLSEDLFTATKEAALQTAAKSDADQSSLNGQSLPTPGDQSDLSGLSSSEGSQATGAYGFVSKLSAFRSINGGATGLPSVVEQVVLQMNRNVKNGQSQMTVQLQPGDLGKIEVKLKVSADGRVQGSVTADNPKTLEMLQKDSRSLERALQDAGLRAEPGSLQFSLGDQKGQNSAGQPLYEQANRSGNENGTSSAGETPDLGVVPIGAISETYYITPSGVNIRV